MSALSRASSRGGSHAYQGLRLEPSSEAYGFSHKAYALERNASRQRRSQKEMTQEMNPKAITVLKAGNEAKVVSVGNVQASVRSEEHVSGVVPLTLRYTLGTEQYMLGTERYMLGTERYMLGTERYMLGTERYMLGTERYILDTKQYMLSTKQFMLSTERYILGEGSRRLEEGGKGRPRCGRWLADGRQWPGGRRPEWAGGGAAEVLGGNGSLDSHGRLDVRIILPAEKELDSIESAPQDAGRRVAGLWLAGGWPEDGGVVAGGRLPCKERVGLYELAAWLKKYVNFFGFDFLTLNFFKTLPPHNNLGLNLELTKRSSSPFELTKRSKGSALTKRTKENIFHFNQN
ncbi:hypothetical protein MA16_Dca027214 [Dendrobium catenatum]|uniref:Uncharacterized protein n=1 Tax=Dendrobium catenatum TaxID=906689 RepID=A0A2I0VEW0_9ASPA|nr:hypothetical protein MA16_Dca027214 [Dendrobium catenatum]